MARHVSYNPDNGCPVEAALDTLGGKWKGVILLLLFRAEHRYSALQQQLPGLSDRMLTKQLKELEADGLIRRDFAAGTPLNVTYALTPLGTDLAPLIKLMTAWGEAYLAQGATDSITP